MRLTVSLVHFMFGSCVIVQLEALEWNSHQHRRQKAKGDARFWDPRQAFCESPAFLQHLHMAARAGFWLGKDCGFRK